jgi:Rne/Rng family ribonuclease
MAGADPSLGLILRSGCAEAEDDAIAEDVAAMRGLAEAVLADISGPPELLVEGAGAHELAFRDWLDPAVDEADTDPGSFDRHGVTEALDTLSSPRVPLDGGGHMVLEPTRALVAVDVNTGPDTSPAASLKVNIAAARELPRQLRLRGLGGQVVVDFAPMPKRDRSILDQVLKAAFKAEGETNLAGWTTLGLYEMTRKRDRLPLAELLAGDAS